MKVEGNKTVLGKRIQIKRPGLGSEIISYITGHKGKIQEREWVMNTSLTLANTLVQQSQGSLDWNTLGISVIIV